MTTPPVWSFSRNKLPRRPAEPQPSEAVVIWREGVRERADDVFYAIGIKRRGRKADFATTWEALTKKIPTEM